MYSVVSPIGRYIVSIGNIVHAATERLCSVDFVLECEGA